jgi:glutamyl-tRNA synthetase
VQRFDLTRLTASPAAINFTKLDHFNGTHVRLLSDTDFARRVKPFFSALQLPADDAALERIAPLIKGRLTTLDDAPNMAGFFFRDKVKAESMDLVPKGVSVQEAAAILQDSIDLVEPLSELRAETVEVAFRGLVERMGRPAGEVFGILRVAVTGQKVSPPLFQTMEIVGRDVVLERLRAARAILEAKD